MNKIKEFMEIADPETRQEIQDLLEEAGKASDRFTRVILLLKIQGVIEARIGLQGTLIPKN